MIHYACGACFDHTMLSLADMLFLLFISPQILVIAQHRPFLQFLHLEMLISHQTEKIGNSNFAARAETAIMVSIRATGTNVLLKSITIEPSLSFTTPVAISFFCSLFYCVLFEMSFFFDFPYPFMHSFCLPN